MMFKGSRHCPHCGAEVATAQPIELSILKCPLCCIDMVSKQLGGSALRECEKCGGLWLDLLAFEKICADREQQSAVLGVASTMPGQPIAVSPEPIKIRYLPCPQCGQLMNRMNFAHCSGVIVDVCRGHGTWFDRDELREIIEFIQRGGLELSRQKEKRAIEFERQQLEHDKLAIERVTFDRSYSDDERIGGLSAARGLLKFLID